MSKKSDKFNTLLICLLLGSATFVVYYQVLNSQFLIFDDDIYVTGNEHVKAGLTRRSISWAFESPQMGFWHPLTWLSHMLDCKLFGLNPKWHHLVNLLFHIANTLLLFWVLKDMTAAVWQSAFVAAAFALHPLHVESVAWVAERKDVLSTMFWLLTVAAYLRYTKKQTAGRYLLTLLLFALGLMAKPMLVTLPFVLLLLDYWPLNRLNRQAIFEKLPFFVLSLVFSVVAYFAQQKMEALSSVLSFGTRLGNALVSYYGYIEKTFWPARLTVFYPHPRDKLPIWHIVIAVVSLLVISVVITRSAKNHKHLLVGWLWYLGTLVPVIGLVQVGSFAMADRYTYLPLVGLFIIIAWGLPELLNRWRYKKFAITALAGIAIAAMSVCTSFQLRFWRNSIILLTHTIKVTVDNYITHCNLGFALQSQGKSDEAIAQYHKALRIKPDYAPAHYNLGAALYSQGKVDEAVGHYRQAVAIKPDDAEVYCNLGIACGKLGRYQDTIEACKQAIRIKPDYVEAHCNLGYALQQQGRLNEAISQYRQAMKVEPENAAVHNYLGNALVAQNKFDEAISHFRQAVKLKPDFAEAHCNLGIAYSNLGRHRDAVESFKQAVRIKPDFADAHYNLGIIYLITGDKASALEEHKILKILDAELANKLFNLIYK